MVFSLVFSSQRQPFGRFRSQQGGAAAADAARLRVERAAGLAAGGRDLGRGELEECHWDEQVLAY